MERAACAEGFMLCKGYEYSEPCWAPWGREEEEMYLLSRRRERTKDEVGAITGQQTGWGGSVLEIQRSKGAPWGTVVDLLEGQ